MKPTVMIPKNEDPSSTWTATILIIIIRDMMIEKTLAALVLLGSETFFFFFFYCTNHKQEIQSTYTCQTLYGQCGSTSFFFWQWQVLFISRFLYLGKFVVGSYHFSNCLQLHPISKCPKFIQLISYIWFDNTSSIDLNIFLS